MHTKELLSCGSIDFSTIFCGFSLVQMRQFYLLTNLSRLKVSFFAEYDFFFSKKFRSLLVAPPNWQIYAAQMVRRRVLANFSVKCKVERLMFIFCAR